MVVAMSDPMSHEFSPQAPQDFEELDRLGRGSLHSDGPGHVDLYDCPVINVSSEVLFQAVSCDLVDKVGEAVPVSGTAIVPLPLQVSRN